MSFTDDISGVTYTPFIDHEDGRVGYTVTRHADNAVTLIYFNPSGDSDDGQANVFIYMGWDGDPCYDSPQCFIDIEFLDKEEDY